MKTAKILALSSFLVILAGALWLAGCKTEEIQPIPTRSETAIAGDQQLNIYDAARSRSDLTQFIKAVDATDLKATISSQGPYTVFAPTDSAWAKLTTEQLDNLFKPENKAQLKQILLNHIVSGRMSNNEISTHDNLLSQGGSQLSIRMAGNVVTVDGANVDKTQVVASNGILHPIDSVIMTK
jgi:uncharacterized surface protein with fasciclin (FAS1) repeats